MRDLLMPPADTLQKHSHVFQSALLDWYHARRRTLPWRETPSLYGTVVSEFMLQQTQIKTALPYFVRWMETLPDFKALASASEEQVLKLWEGLGYYSRARNLHRLAKALLSLPSIPKDQASWCELPGIGPYSSAAITSIAFGSPAACVDGNVVRILARLTADESPYRDSASAAKGYTPLAVDLLNRKHPGDHNQAMMELGATVCTKHNPTCMLCPVANWCEGRKQGIAENLPRLAAKKIEQRAVLRLLCVSAKGLLLHKAPAGAKRLASILELPSAADLGLDTHAFTEDTRLATYKRSITRFQITEAIHRAKAPAKLPSPDLLWVPLADLETITLSGPHRRWLGQLAGHLKPH